VIIAAEVRGRGIGRIRLESLKNDRMGHIIGFVRKTIAPASEIISDGSWAYRRLTELGYRHSRTVLHNKGREAPSVALPRVHRIASLLKRWLLGTYQGRPSRKQLQHYLAEFTFRFNRRKSPTRGMLFFRLAQQCVGREPTPYRSLVGTL
jgi:transposase-like protein